MKKNIIRFLAVLLALTMLASCGKTGKNSKKTPKKSTVQTGESIDNDDVEDMTEDDDGEYDDEYDDEWYEYWDEIEDDYFDYDDAQTIDFSMLSIVYEADASKEKQYLIDTFHQDLNDNYFMARYDDKTARKNDSKEIIIGDTNRAESAKTAKMLTDYRKNCDADFIIMETNGNVVINATSNYGLRSALEYFKKTFCKDEFTAEIPINYFFHHKANLSVSNATLFGTKLNQYTIVTKRDASFIYSKEIDALVNYVCSVSGIEIPVLDDRTAKKDCEILVGDTNRPQSNVSHSKEADYSVTQNGKKIVLSAGSDIALAGAVKVLTEKIKKSVKDLKKISVSTLNEKGTYTSTGKTYKLVWNDEFDGTDLDFKKWKRITQTDTAWDGAVCKRTNSTKNSYLEDGKLIIQGLVEDDGNYSSAKLSTIDSMYFKYGYYEIRARLPEGAGLWPGFWSVPTTPIFPEIDVFEMFGISNQIQFTLHKWWSSTTGGSGHESPQDIYYPDTTKIVELKNGEKYSEAFHTIGCEWTPEHVALYVDGFKYTECNIQAEGMDVFHHPIGVILSMAVGLTGIMKPDDTTVWPARFEIDYFRLYQIPGVGSITVK